MKKISIFRRFRYWLDRRMAKGTASMVKLLLWMVLSAVLLVTVLVILFGLGKEGKSYFAIFWDNLRSAMSSSFPSSDSGSVLYIVLYTLLGLVGMVFTGMLIGIFSSTIRGRLLALQSENSPVLESGHFVVLGFRPGEYALLAELIEAAGGEKRTIVVADDMERVDMEKAVFGNLKVPKNIRMIFRKTDVTNPRTMQCCSIPQSRSVVIHAHDKGLAVKCLLAVTSLLEGVEDGPEIVATVDAEKAILPADTMRNMNISMVHSGDMVARIIARAATQPGVFEAFMEMISFHGFEFYPEKIKGAEGLLFGQLVLGSQRGIAVGLCRKGKTVLNPPPETRIEEEDLIFVFEEEPGSVKIKGADRLELPAPCEIPPLAPIPEMVIIGANQALPTILKELPDHIETIKLAGLTPQQRDLYLPDESIYTSEVICDFRSLDSDQALTELVQDASHLILLNDKKKAAEDADTDMMLLIIRLRDIKRRLKLGFTITAEMRSENNKKLIMNARQEDFIVATDLSSMILAQISEDTRRAGLFSDLLDENGSEVYLKTPQELGIDPALSVQLSVSELREKVYSMGYILMGLQTKDQSFRLLDRDEQISFTGGTRLVLIGED